MGKVNLEKTIKYGKSLQTGMVKVLNKSRKQLVKTEKKVLRKRSLFDD